jgi:phage-related minor tail protein
MATIGELVYKIKGDAKDLERNLGQAQKSFKQFGDNLSKTGKKLSLAVTAPIAGLGVVAVKAFAQQEKAELQLRAALEANGRQVDTLFNDYKQFASELQKVTTVGDETTLAMLQQAESLGLTGDAAKRAIENSIGLSKAFGINEESAIRYTAALEEGNTTMLNRYFPALREIEDESERVAKAQELLSKGFKVALSEADTTAGQLIQLKNEVGDLAEEFGAQLAPILIDIVNEIRPLVQGFKDLSPQTKKLIVTLAGLAAAVGPVLLIVGKLVTAIAAFNPVTGVIVAAVVAVGLLTKSWLEYKEAADKAAQANKDLEEQFGSKKAVEY